MPLGASTARAARSTANLSTCHAFLPIDAFSATIAPAKLSLLPKHTTGLPSSLLARATASQSRLPRQVTDSDHLSLSAARLTAPHRLLVTCANAASIFSGPSSGARALLSALLLPISVALSLRLVPSVQQQDPPCTNGHIADADARFTSSFGETRTPERCAPRQDVAHDVRIRA